MDILSINYNFYQAAWRGPRPGAAAARPRAPLPDPCTQCRSCPCQQGVWWNNYPTAAPQRRRRPRNRRIMPYEQARALYFPDYTQTMRFDPPASMPPMIQDAIYENIAQDCVEAGLSPFQPIETRRMVGLRRRVVNWDVLLQRGHPSTATLADIKASAAPATSTSTSPEPTETCSVHAACFAGAASVVVAGQHEPAPPAFSSAFSTDAGLVAAPAVAATAATSATTAASTTACLSRREARATSRITFTDTLDTSPWPVSIFRRPSRWSSAAPTSAAACVVISDDETTDMDDVEPD